jgi:hypothetical protein
MTVSTPTVSGQILTSAYVNNNINSGLTYITSATIGTGVATATVSGAFSADYDNYRVIISNVTCSANQPNFRLQLGAAVTGYSYGGFEIGYGPGVLTAAAQSNGASWYIGNFGNATSMSSVIEIQRPFATQNTNYCATAGSTAWSVVQNGFLNDTTSYTALTIFAASGTITGGTIAVYGYRKV